MKLLPISAIIPTRDRTQSLNETLRSLAKQNYQPREIVVVDASINDKTRELCRGLVPELTSDVRYLRATQKGAAIQRNEGVAKASELFVLFMDDDIIFEPECVGLVWQAINTDQKIGGVSAMIVNQHYEQPSEITRCLYRLLHGRTENTYAGRVIGPAVNLLPADHEDLPDLMRVDWLNLGCTLYRREALPNPPFLMQFTGYSLLEDVALSLEVGKQWRLVNARTARIFHYSQPGEHKRSDAQLSEMELINRHYVMTKLLHRDSGMDYLRLALFELYQVLGTVKNCPTRFPAILRGKFHGLQQLRKSLA